MFKAPKEVHRQQRLSIANGHFSFWNNFGATCVFQNTDFRWSNRLWGCLGIDKTVRQRNEHLHICLHIPSNQSTVQCSACGRFHHPQSSEHMPANAQNDSDWLNFTWWGLASKTDSRYESGGIKGGGSGWDTWYSNKGFAHLGLQWSSRCFFWSTGSSSALNR